MASRYWVGGTGNWSDTTHWSTTTGGSSGAAVPTSSDNVFFDANSFSTTGQTVTIDVSASCADMDWTGALHSPTLSFSTGLSIYGSLTFVSGMSLGPGFSSTAVVNFSSTSTGKTITMAGVQWPSGWTNQINFNGVGGGWTLQDDFSAGTTNLSIWLSNGSLNTNGKAVTAREFHIRTGTKSLTLGASTVTVLGWSVDDATNLTFDAGTSSITLSHLGGGFAFKGGGLTYYNVTNNTLANSPTGPSLISGSNTFNNLTLQAASGSFSPIYFTFSAGSTQTINGTFATTSTDSTHTLNIRSSTSGSTFTLSQASGTVTASYIDIKDSVATGGAIWIANNSTDSGNNTGWNFAVPTVTTQAASSITATTATGNGNITATNGPVDERGVVYGTTSLSDPGNVAPASSSYPSVVNETGGSFTTGAFTESITGLTHSTTYYARAYAHNGDGYSYGAQISFTTSSTTPTVTTTTPSSIDTTTATGGGNVTDDGGATITERGICWSTSANPTTANSKATASGTTGSYTASFSSLTEATTYHVRAYAINANGTSYGSDVQFNSAGLTNPTNAYSADGIFATTPASSGDITIKLSKDGGITWTTGKVNTFTGTNTLMTYGTGSTELWGITWLGSDTTNANFMVKVICGGYVGGTIYKTFSSPISGSEQVTGVLIEVKAKWDGTTTSVDYVGAQFYYSNAVGAQIQAGSVAFATDAATTGALEVYNGSAWKEIADTSSAQTLTNKTISGASNTITNLGNAALSNSSITIAGTSTSLGGSITLDTITGLSTTGLVKRTGANTLATVTAPSGTVVGDTDTQTLTNKTLDTPVVRNWDGWEDANETWTYASGSGTNQATFTVAGVDVTGKYNLGDRVKFTQTTVKYGIIVKTAFSTDTTISIYMGTDYTIANAAISSNYYSHLKSPQGFPLDPTKWTESVTINATTAVSAGWSNFGSIDLTVPIGAWDIYGTVTAQVTRTASNEMTVAISESTTALTSGYEETITSFGVATGTTTNLILGTAQMKIRRTYTSATAIHIILITVGSGNLYTARGNRHILRATCAYL